MVMVYKRVAMPVGHDGAQSYTSYIESLFVKLIDTSFWRSLALGYYFAVVW